MRGVPRLTAAALGVCGVVGVVALLASGAGGGTAALVSLQVAPRGPGIVSGKLTASGEEHVCGSNSFARECVWSVERGSTIELTARASEGPGNSFAGWSEPDCGTGASCTLQVGDDTASVAALFSPLRLGVFFSGDSGGAAVAAEPRGQPCREPIVGEVLCAEYPANTPVRLTLTPGSTPFRGWSDAERSVCEPVTSTTCTVVVADEPTSIGARFDDNPPNLPPTISVEFKLRKSGDGRGRVTASKIDCGTACSAQYGFGKKITLTATPEEGSHFAGWGRVCAATDPSCTLPVGPVTSVTAVFSRDTTPPTPPGTPRVTRRARTALGLAWTAATDNVAVTGYRVYRNGIVAGDTRETSFTVRGLRCGTRYGLAVDAADRAGNRSERASVRVGTRPCALVARLVRVSVRRVGRTRVLELTLRVNLTTTAHVRLARATRPATARRFRVVAGTNRLRLRLARRLPAGRYRIGIWLANPDGRRVVLPTRRVAVPRP